MSRRRGLAGGLAVGLVLVLVVTWLGARGSDEGPAIGSGARRVVIIGVIGLSFGDLHSGKFPAITGLAQSGAVAALSARTAARRPGPLDTWATLSAGTDAVAASQAGLALPASATIENGTAGDALARRQGGPAPVGGVVVLGGPASIERNRGRHAASVPGALGTALHASGRVTGTTGQGAALGVMDRRSVVDTLVTEAFAAGPDVVTVEAGGPMAAERLVSGLSGGIPPGVLVVVIALASSGQAPQLSPVIVAGPGVQPGTLSSASTRRSGVVTLPDVGATVLAVTGSRRLTGMSGQPLAEEPAGRVNGAQRVTSLGHLRDLQAFADRAFRPATNAFVALSALLYLLAGVGLRASGGRWAEPGRWMAGAAQVARTALSPLALFLATLPIATYLMKLVPGVDHHGAEGLGVVLVVAAAVAAIFGWRPVPARRAFNGVLVVTLAVLLGDVLSGSHLQTSTILGNSLVQGARFWGVGNATLGLLGGGAVVLAAVLYEAYGTQSRLLAVAVFSLAAAGSALPWLGGKVGAVLTLVPVFTLITWWMGRRLRAAAWTCAATATAVALAVVIVADLIRPARDRSHLGRLAAATARERTTLVDTVVRKIGTDVRVLRGSHWTEAVVIAGVWVLWVAVWQGRWKDFAPGHRMAVAGVAGIAVLGIATNDSGVLVAALALAVLGPWLVLTMLTVGLGASVAGPPIGHSLADQASVAEPGRHLAVEVVGDRHPEVGEDNRAEVLHGDGGQA